VQYELTILPQRCEQCDKKSSSTVHDLSLLHTTNSNIKPHIKTNWRQAQTNS